MRGPTNLAWVIGRNFPIQIAVLLHHLRCIFAWRLLLALRDAASALALIAQRGKYAPPELDWRPQEVGGR